jgi:large subunit ribosomal protein L28
MSRRCDLIAAFGKQKGNQVSHSNRKMIKHFKPNLQSMEFYSETLNQKFRLKVSVKTNRTIVKYGGLDEFLLSRPASKPGSNRAACKILTPLGLKIRRAVKKKKDMIASQVTQSN